LGSRTRFFTLLLVAFALLFAACGDGEGTTTTAPPSSVDESTATAPESSVAPSSTEAPSSTSAPATTTTTAAPSTTATAEPGVPECLTYWSEQLIQDLVGANWSFMQANIDGTTCTFTATPDTIAVFFRPSDQALFEMAKEGAALTGTLVELTIETCTDAYLVDIGGIVIAESYSEQQGRAFNATVAVDDAVDVATSLIETACEGPFSN
jgi:hypothetical protein